MADVSNYLAQGHRLINNNNHKDVAKKLKHTRSHANYISPKDLGDTRVYEARTYVLLAKNRIPGLF